LTLYKELEKEHCKREQLVQKPRGRKKPRQKKRVMREANAPGVCPL
jgi:hypothetical protein